LNAAPLSEIGQDDGQGRLRFGDIHLSDRREIVISDRRYFPHVSYKMPESYD